MLLDKEFSSILSGQAEWEGEIGEEEEAEEKTRKNPKGKKNWKKSSNRAFISLSFF